MCLLLNLRRPRDRKSTIFRRAALYFCARNGLLTVIFPLFKSGRGFFSRSRRQGTQGTRVDITVRVPVPAELHGACSGPLKSRNMANNHGEMFRTSRIKQTHKKPPSCCLLPFLKHRSSPQRLDSHGTTAALQVFPL